jgi:hypothetical protein
MKSISVKISDSVFEEMEKILAQVEVSENQYINEAIVHYNALQNRLLLEKQLLEESALVAYDSMTVLREFEGIGEEC